MQVRELIGLRRAVGTSVILPDIFQIIPLPRSLGLAKVLL